MLPLELRHSARLRDAGEADKTGRAEKADGVGTVSKEEVRDMDSLESVLVKGPPAVVIIRADELLMYAWSGQGDCLGHGGLRMVAQCFEGHGRLSELVDLDYEFWDWVQRFPGRQETSAKPWREYHLQGLELAHWLANLLREQEVQVYYACLLYTSPSPRD